MKLFIKRDTQAWVGQTWASFGIAVFLCFVAVWNMPSVSLDRLVAALGLLFVLSSTFTLSKMLRDNQYEQVDTHAWKIQCWSAFLISTAITAWGIFRMSIDVWHKWFVVAAALFLLSSAFTLAKTLRDAQEAKVLEKSNNNSQE